ncbi:BTB/POZ and TAZ domain-containing protein 3 [Dioscorea cayenensis subsp. rotundata]|uniref:BTB/POZ and TAZ domain-containing protein 3 n=1 Tax=Dioscorea cayennensis subsp. rotundata TaxID=55577 RepID=A0AB40AT29_DIOCR|nr:BTB/POZ and TAZ domain-containing protein 3 [Dioscorea cayenensis subsp. rotundata]
MTVSRSRFLDVPDASKPSLSSFSSSSSSSSVPKPPPLPSSANGGCSSSKRLTGYSYVLDETRLVWDKLFHEGYEADVHVLTDDKSTILSHSCVLGISSAVIRNLLAQAKIRGGIRRIKIHGVPSEAANAFVRFLYSSSYEPDDMKNYVLHLLVMSHSYSIPSLKKVCINQVEQALLNAENVVDILQLARLCDAPRLTVLCTRMIMKDFKTISLSEGWKVMRQTNPELEQELLESLVEADSKRQEKMKKMEERKVYLRLNEAMEALVHICRDGCQTIGPSGKVVKDNQTACKFPACKGLESLVRHFSSCKTRVPGGCTHCKRMWQLFELHSLICSELEFCKVPLCRHFKAKIKNQSRKEEMKWNLLASKVIAVKGTLSSISARRIFVP